MSKKIRKYNRVPLSYVVTVTTIFVLLLCTTPTRSANDQESSLIKNTENKLVKNTETIQNLKKEFVETPKNTISKIITDWSTVVLAAATCILVIITFCYTRHTKSLAKIALKQLQQSEEERKKRIDRSINTLFLELLANNDVPQDKKGNEAPRLSSAYDSCFWALSEIGVDSNTISAVCRAYIHIKWHKIAYENIAENRGASGLAEKALKESIPAAIKAMRNDPSIKEILKNITD